MRVGNGHMTEYSPTSAFWLFNRVAQYAYLRYNTIGKAVREAADKWENEKLAEVKKVDEMALANPDKAVEIVTGYTVKAADDLFKKWDELDKYLLVKYKDGNNMREDASGFVDNGYNFNIPVMPAQPGYSDKWKDAVVKDHGDVLRVVPIQ